MDSNNLAQIVAAAQRGPSDNAAIIALGAMFMVLVGLIVILRWVGQRRGPSKTDQDAARSLWDTARRMEARIENLESVLDSEAPGWRGRSKSS